MIFKKFWAKLTNNQKYQELKYKEQSKKNVLIFKKHYENEINLIKKKIYSQERLNFFHSGHAADIINVLPVIKKLSINHKCNLYINLNKPIKFYYKHPAGKYYINDKIFKMLLPLLQKQKYLNEIKVFDNHKIDINFDLIRELPINLLFDNATYASVVTGINPDLSSVYIDADEHKEHKKKIIIQRTFRYRNELINYKFLNKYGNLIFVGTPNEYEDLKNDIPNLGFYDCKDFLDMANIIKSSKILIANSSIAFPIAEGLKKPRLLEASPEFPAAQPHGENSFNFYFQSHFEEKFNILNKLS